jgi:ABC-type dipeptide/oligopeptide/nickel transport system ATPase component
MPHGDQKPVSWLWDPYIPATEITEIVGDAGSGKTHLCFQLAMMFAGFHSALPNGYLAIQQHRTLYVGDAPAKPEFFDDEDGGFLSFLPNGEAFPLSWGLYLKEKRIEVVVVDELFAFLNGTLGLAVDLNNFKESADLSAFLRDSYDHLGITAIHSRHLVKERGDGVSTQPQGSIVWQGAASSRLGVHPHFGSGLRTIEHQKSAVGELGPDLLFSIGERGFLWEEN